MNSGQACQPCRGSCSSIPGRGCFGDLPGDEIVVSPPSPIVEPLWTSTSLDVPAGVTQEKGHTGFLIHLLSAVRALFFFARRIQPFLSLVDREVEVCVLTIKSFSTRWAFLFCFLVHVPTCQKVTRYLWATGARKKGLEPSALSLASLHSTNWVTHALLF